MKPCSDVLRITLACLLLMLLVSWLSMRDAEAAEPAADLYILVAAAMGKTTGDDVLHPGRSEAGNGVVLT